MEHIIIRKAKISDLEAVAELQRKLDLSLGKFDHVFYTREKNAKKNWIAFAKKEMRSNNTILLVALDRNKIIGYTKGIIVYNSPPRKIRKTGLISNIFIEKSYRRQGIAKEFIKELINWFRLKRMPYIELYAHSRNKLALKAWYKVGFKESKKLMKKNI